MFKVECPGCKAPYQVDERRVPSSGLKMRCPKCGTSFQVDPPDDGRRTGPSPALGAPQTPPGPAQVARPPLKNPAARTMVGVAPSHPAVMSVCAITGDVDVGVHTKSSDCGPGSGTIV